MLTRTLTVGCTAFDKIPRAFVSYRTTSLLFNVPICDNPLHPFGRVATSLLDTHSRQCYQCNCVGSHTESIPPSTRSRFRNTDQATPTRWAITLPVHTAQNIHWRSRKNRRRQVRRRTACRCPYIICEATLRDIRGIMHACHRPAHNEKARSRLRRHMDCAAHNMHTLLDTATTVLDRSPAR